MPHSQQSNGRSSTIDWAMVRARMRYRLAAWMDSGRSSELEDLVQEGCVRVLRASRREPIDDLEAMVVVIARRTFRDWLRRRYRYERLCRPLEEVPEIAAEPSGDPRYGDLIERIEFMVIEIFRREDRQQCLELARGWFAGRNWKELAEQLGQSHASIRKRWSRCLELPRRILGSDPGLAPLSRRMSHE